MTFIKVKFVTGILGEAKKSLDRTAKVLKGLNLVARAGVLGSSASRPGQMSNVDLAVVHEFGSSDGHVPERSFVRSAFLNNRKNYSAAVRALLPRVIKQEITPENALNLLGAQMATDIKQGITRGAGIPPPLAASTIAEKGSSRPLVDTGQLLNSITWEVGPRNSK